MLDPQRSHTWLACRFTVGALLSVAITFHILWLTLRHSKLTQYYFILGWEKNCFTKILIINENCIIQWKIMESTYKRSARKSWNFVSHLNESQQLTFQSDIHCKKVNSNVLCLCYFLHSLFLTFSIMENRRHTAATGLRCR